MYRSQFMPQVDPVGTIKFFPPMGTGFTVGEKEWLKTGFAKDKTNYSEAAATLATQVVGIYGNAHTSSSNPETLSSATNGAGTIIAIHGYSSDVRISTDYGATWSTTAVSVLSPTCIAYNGTTWIIVGNTAGSTYIQTSTNPASSWTALQTITYSPGNATADTASVCWDSVNSKFIIVMAANTGGEAALYSSTGASGSWTKVTFASALNGRTSIAAYNGTVIAGGYGNGVTQKSTNGGAGWTAGNSGITNGSNIVAASGKFFRSTSTSLLYTTDNTTWTTSTTVPETGFSTGNYQTLASDGTTVFFNANQAKYIGYTTDGVTFTVKPANWAANYGTSIACMGVNKIFCVDNGGTVSKTLRSVNVDTCDYVGTSTTFYNIGTTYQNGYLVGYVRIK